MILYYDRAKKQMVEEIEYEKKTLEFLYHTVLGRLCLKLFVARPWFSHIQGIWKKSRFSIKGIQPFIEKYHLSINQKEMVNFQSFNDFFTRAHPPILEEQEDALIAPADSKMSFYTITEDLMLTIKNTSYTIADLIEDDMAAKKFRNGTCIVYRLSVADNHHYYYIDEGKLVFHKKIAGALHTIRPISERYHVFTRNTREVSLLETKHLGDMIQIEIGALLVGKIQNLNKTTFKKNDEKGFFEFGGSTIVLLLNQKVQFDADIERMNEKGYETKVFAGEKVGMICYND